MGPILEVPLVVLLLLAVLVVFRGQPRCPVCGYRRVSERELARFGMKIEICSKCGYRW